MRFKKYVCPSGRSWGCSYTIDFDAMMSGKHGEQPCTSCGKTSKETDTIWTKIYDFWLFKIYYSIPHAYRPKEVWYKFKCWAWKRYTTVKPRKLDHTWIDRSHLVFHVVFEVLSDFVENELDRQSEDHPTPVNLCSEYNDWNAAEKELREIHKWWINDYDEHYIWNLQDEDFDRLYPWTTPEDYDGKDYRPVARVKADIQYTDMILAKAKRVIELSPYMWT